MCLVLFAYRYHPEYDLILLANRDEYYDRPTRPAEFWSDEPDILAGRDLRAGGTWMGITKGGRYAAVTNFREGRREARVAPSRGALVTSYLRASESPEAFMDKLRLQASRYNGFNLIAGERDSLYYFSNREGQVRQLEPGLYGLSNHLLDTPWHKVEQGKAALAAVLGDGRAISPGDLLPILANEEPAPEDMLPDTGVGQDWERALSSMFISTPVYGTRSSTVLLIDRDGQVQFVERTVTPDAPTATIHTYSFLLEP